MRFITVATSENPALDRFLRSCRENGIHMELLGMGRPYTGHGMKIVLVREFLKGCDPDEIVLFTDAYDSVFLAGPQRIEAAYLEFDHPLVFSAEQNFRLKAHPLFYPWLNFPHWWRYPKTDTPYRFLNSGSYIGRAGYMLQLFDRLGIDETNPSDQTSFSKHYAAHPGAIALDTRQAIFTCNGGRAGLEEEDYARDANGLVNRLTGTHPCILHTPGDCLVGLDLLYDPEVVEGRYDAGALRRYRRLGRRNRFISRTLKDNFLYRFLLVNVLIAALFVGLVVAII